MLENMFRFFYKLGFWSAILLITLVTILIFSNDTAYCAIIYILIAITFLRILKTLLFWWERASLVYIMKNQESL